MRVFDCLAGGILAYFTSIFPSVSPLHRVLVSYAYRYIFIILALTFLVLVYFGFSGELIFLLYSEGYGVLESKAK